MRLPSGYGSVIKLKGNRRRPYQARITKGRTDTGRIIYGTLGYFPTQKEALSALEEYNKNPYDLEENKITFAEVFEKWSKNHFEKVSDSAVVNYNNAYNKYCQSLYNMRFKDIRLSHLQGIIDNCGMAHPTRAVIKTLFNVLFKFAVSNDICDKNYAQYVDVGKREGKINRKPFTDDEIQKIFDNVDKMEYINTLAIMIFTGLRISELLDIKIQNVYLDKRYMIGGMKTEAGRDRIIPISKKIEPFIKEYYEKNKDKEFLIVNSFGKQMKYSNYRREKWDNIVEKLGMEQHRPHDCRHSFATLMDRAGANPLCIKRIMGHAAPDLLGKTYTHKDIEDLINAIDLI